MLVKRLRLAPDVVLTVGEGEDAGLVSAISAASQVKVLLPPKPRITAAYGATCRTVDDHA